MSGPEDDPKGNLRRPVGGSDQVWSMISTLVAGPVAWGGIGYGVDAVTGSSGFLAGGVVFGFVASLAYVLWRFAHPHDAGPEIRRGERP
jgi:hypothetical protein